jgi:hypothetical protein
MADNTQSGAPSAKRAKVCEEHDGTRTIRDLPDDAVKEIMKYDMADALSNTCLAFHAIRRTFTPYKVTVSRDTVGAIACYPHDTTNTQMVVLSRHWAIHRELQKKAFSKMRPRFPHATTLVIAGSYDDAILMDTVLMLVDLKKIRYLNLKGIRYSGLRVVPMSPLQHLANFYAAGASPAKVCVALSEECLPLIDILDRAEKLHVYMYPGSSDWTVRFKFHPRIKALVISGDCTPASLTRLYADNRSVYKLRIGSAGPPNTTEIADPALYRALIRGGQPCVFAPTGQQWLGDMGNITFGSHALEGFLRRVEPIPGRIRIPHHAMLVAIKRFSSIECNLQLEAPSSHFYSALPAILEEVPSSAKFTMAEWTVLRATALTVLSFMVWDDHEVRKSLMHTWASCCCNRSTTRGGFVRAAINEIYRQLRAGNTLKTGELRFNATGVRFVRERVLIPFLIDLVPKDLRILLGLDLYTLEIRGAPKDDKNETHGADLNEEVFPGPPLSDCMLHANCNPWY